MAVIKLCRPQMEVDTTSLIERVRMLEKKLDDLEANGIQAAPVQSAAPVSPADDVIDQKGMKEYQDKLAMELPKAEFEDLQRAAENWNDILEKLSVPARRYLKRNDACRRAARPSALK